VNGSVGGGNSDKFCSKMEPRWLQVDLGADYDVHGFVLKHAEAGEEAADLNTRDFDLLLSPDGAAWTTVVTVTASTASLTTHPIATRRARYRAARRHLTHPGGQPVGANLRAGGLRDAWELMRNSLTPSPRRQ
jgi:hypothetical protein